MYIFALSRSIPIDCLTEKTEGERVNRFELFLQCTKVQTYKCKFKKREKDLFYRNKAC